MNSFHSNKINKIKPSLCIYIYNPTAQLREIKRNKNIGIITHEIIKL